MKSMKFRKNPASARAAIRAAVPCLVFAAGAAIAPAAIAQGGAANPAVDPQAGKQLVDQVCSGCHGPGGNSTVPNIPKIAGQHRDYLVKQLVDFAKPPEDKTSRSNAIMSGIASSLTPTDRRNVATWLAEQKMSPGAPAADKAEWEIGQRLYRTGNATEAVPACAGCHGPNGDGLPARYPRLAGQNADYVDAQLRAFRDGTRHNNEAMQQIAFRLSDPNIKALVTYISSLQSQ